MAIGIGKCRINPNAECHGSMNIYVPRFFSGKIEGHLDRFPRIINILLMMTFCTVGSLKSCIPAGILCYPPLTYSWQNCVDAGYPRLCESGVTVLKTYNDGDNVYDL